MTARERGTRGIVLGGLVVAIVVGVVLSAFAASQPDGLESAVVKTQCADAPDPEACLEDAAGDPVYTAAPLPDYEITWLSGLLGVAVSFVIGAGVVALLRRGRTSPPRAPAEPSRG